MADNLNYLPASGTTIQPIATDDIGGVHYQKMKLDGGTDGNSMPITGSTNWGLTVDVKRSVSFSGKVAAISGAFLDNVVVDREIKWAAISATAASLTVIVSGIANTKLRVIAATLVSDAAVSIRWKSGTGTTKIDQMAFAKNGGMDVNRAPHGWFVETDPGGHLCLDLSGAANVRGSINYIEVPA